MRRISNDYRYLITYNYQTLDYAYYERIKTQIKIYYCLNSYQ